MLSLTNPPPDPVGHGECHGLPRMPLRDLASLLHSFPAAKPTSPHFFRNVTIGIFPWQAGFKQDEVEW
jgi:hypothetical protein